MLRACSAWLVLMNLGGSTAAQLAATPPTHPEPYLVRDLIPGPEGGGPTGLRAWGNRVLGYAFELIDTSASSPTQWLYRYGMTVSDGTEEGTFPILPEHVSLQRWWQETGSEQVSFFAVCDAPLILTLGCLGLPAVWRTDGTPDGTFQLPAFVSSFGRFGLDGHFYQERKLFFFRGADLAHGIPRFDLWVSDGTEDGTRLFADLNPSGSSSPGFMLELDSMLYFTAHDGQRWRLGRSDGTVEGTHLLPSPAGGRAHALGLWRADDAIFAFFWIADESLSLWRKDGSSQGLTLLADLGTVSPSLVSVVGAGGKKLYFLIGESFIGGLGLIDAQLWASDGTPEGTRQVPRPPKTVLSEHGHSYRFSRVLGDRIYFGIDDGVHGFEPWVSDGTPEGTRMIHDMCPGSCDAQGFFGFEGLLDEVHVMGRLGDGPTELLVYNPEAGELRELADVCPGKECAAGGSVLAEARSLAYLTLNDRVHGPQLWVTDGTASGTFKVSDFKDPDPFWRSVVPWRRERSPAAVAGGRLFFATEDEEHGWELWAVEIPGSGNNIPPRPPADPLTTPGLPGFAAWVRITPSAGEAILGRVEADCIPETLCVSGALAGRSEVFVRVVGPRPNGRLWPVLVKFTTSTVEVWIEQLSTGLLRYYRLEGASSGSSELPGLFDRDGFPPS